MKIKSIFSSTQRRPRNHFSKPKPSNGAPPTTDGTTTSRNVQFSPETAPKLNSDPFETEFITENSLTALKIIPAPKLVSTTTEKLNLVLNNSFYFGPRSEFQSEAAFYKIVEPFTSQISPETLILVQHFRPKPERTDKTEKFKETEEIEKIEKFEETEQIEKTEKYEKTTEKTTTSQSPTESALKLRKMPKSTLFGPEKFTVNNNEIEFFHMPQEKIFGFSSVHFDSKPSKFTYKADPDEKLNNIRMRIGKDPDEDNYNILVENFGQETEIEEDTEIETTTIPDTTEDSLSV